MAERQPRESATSLDDVALVLAVRGESPAAIAELYRRYAPLLRRRASGWRLGPAERDELVAEVIGDVALALMRPDAAVPRSLAAYLLVALRHRLGALHARTVRDAHDDLAALDLLAPSGDDAAAPHPVLARLAAHLDAELRDDDRRLLTWLADHVPMRTAAEWLGIGYDAALKRASRLRARLRTRALAHVATLPPHEQRVVHAFLGRAARAASPEPEPGP